MKCDKCKKDFEEGELSRVLLDIQQIIEDSCDPERCVYQLKGFFKEKFLDMPSLKANIFSKVKKYLETNWEIITKEK